MNDHRYILEPYRGMNTRYHCPGCQQRDKTFSLYIDTATGEHIAPSVGRCNRESNCGYHYTPKQYFQDNNILFDTPPPKGYRPKPVTPLLKPVSFIPVEVFTAGLKRYNTNNFVKYLIDLFGIDIAYRVCEAYFIGTSKHWPGATVFWQIDTKGKIRTGKIMLYSPTTGKRVKEPFNHITWVHKALKQPEPARPAGGFELRQCLFGEHLLQDKTNPVAIVESEKTAVIASVYLPRFIWLAVGSLTNLNAEKCSVLKGRSVILFPDLNGFEKWNTKAKELSHIARITVSDLLERKATEAERKDGLDLADYLVRFDFLGFARPEPKATEPPPAVQPLIEVKAIEQPNPVYYFTPTERGELSNPESWERVITELENYFTEIALPTQPVKLNPSSIINNCSLFIQNHLTTVKANNSKRTYLPYLNRLHELKQVLTSNFN